MNNKAQLGMIYGLMLAIVIFILLLALAFPIKQSSDIARNVTTESGEAGLDCTNSTISDFNKAACISSDLTLFAYIIGGFFIAGIIMIGMLINDWTK